MAGYLSGSMAPSTTVRSLPSPMPPSGLVLPPWHRQASGRPNLPAPAFIAFPGRPEASEEAKRTRFGAYYRISHRAILGDPENPSLKRLPETTGMDSKKPRFSAIFGDGMRTHANCHSDAKIPMAIGV